MNDPPGLRDCPRCGSPLRPAVVWFGEAMPPDAWDAAERACLQQKLIGISAGAPPKRGALVTYSLFLTAAGGRAHAHLK